MDIFFLLSNLLKSFVKFFLVWIWGSNWQFFFIPATVTASNLTNMLGGGSGPNQLMRHVSSVGEHVSSSFTVTPIAKRAETFAGFDTTFELSKGTKAHLKQ